MADDFPIPPERLVERLRQLREARHQQWFEERTELRQVCRYEVRALAVLHWTAFPGWCTWLAGDKAGFLYRLDVGPTTLTEPDGPRPRSPWRSIPEAPGGAWCCGSPGAEPWRELGCIQALEPLGDGSGTGPRWVAVGTRVGGVRFWRLLPPGAVPPEPEPLLLPGPTVQPPWIRSLAFLGETLWVGGQQGPLRAFRLRLAPDVAPLVVEQQELPLGSGAGYCLAHTEPDTDSPDLFAGTDLGGIFQVMVQPDGWPHPLSQPRRLHELGTPVRGLAVLQDPHHPGSLRLAVAGTFDLLLLQPALRSVAPPSPPQVIPFHAPAGRPGGIILALEALRHGQGWWVACGTDQGTLEFHDLPLHGSPTTCARLQLEATQLYRLRLATHGAELVAVVGTSDNRLRVLVRRAPGTLLATLLRELAGYPLATLLDRLSGLAAERPLDSHFKEGAALLLSHLCPAERPAELTPERWPQLETCVYQLAFQATPAGLDDLLHLLHRLATVVPYTTMATELRRYVQKYCCEGLSFSAKGGRRLELIRDNRPQNPLDALIYRGSLISRGLDPEFHCTFTGPARIGETTFFTPLWPRRTQGPCPDQPPAFLLGTRQQGCCWLIDWPGRPRPLSLPAPDQYLQSVFVGGESLFLCSSAGGVWRGPLKQLLEAPAASWDPARLIPVAHDQDVRAVCPVFEEQHGPQDRFFWADGRGRLGLCDGEHFHLLWAPSGSRSHAIADLRSFRHGTRRLLAAACSDGLLRLYDVDGDGVSGRTRITPLADLADGQGALPLDDHPLTTLSPVRGGLLACASSPGHVYAVRLDGRSTPSSTGAVARAPGSLTPVVAWSYRAGGRVGSLSWFRFAPPSAPDGLEALLIASLDCTLHALDRHGRTLDTVRLPGFPLARAWFGRPTPAAQQEGVLATVRIAAYEDGFCGGNYLYRKAFLREILEQELLARPPAKQEQRLLRWRAIRLTEPFFRVAYCLRSPELTDPTRILVQLRSLLEGPVDEVRTGYLVGLVRRLFGRGWVERLLPRPPLAGEAIPPAPDGSLYAQAMRLLEEVRSRWGGEAGRDSHRVQLYTIRSLLRGLQNAEQFCRWWEDREAGAEALLADHLRHDVPILRFKTVEYLERLLFGPPDAPRTGGILHPTLPRGLRLRLVNHVLEALFECVGRGKRDLVAGSPYWVTDRVCGLLVRLLLAEREVLCPCYLIHRTRKAALHPAFFERLAEVLRGWEVGEGPRPAPPLADWAKLVQNAARMIQLLGELDQAPHLASSHTETQLEQVLRHYVEFCHCCEQAGACPRADFGSQARQLLSFAADQLALRTLDDFGSGGGAARALTWPPHSAGLEIYYPGRAVQQGLAVRDRLRRALRRYWEVVQADVFGASGRGPLRTLHVGHFLALEQEFARAGEELRDEREPERFVLLLFRAIVRHWRRILAEQKREYLITDFLQGLAQLPVPAGRPMLGVGDPSREPLDYYAAIGNLFQRLFLAGEVDRAYLLIESRLEQAGRLFELDRPRCLGELTVAPDPTLPPTVTNAAPPPGPADPLRAVTDWPPELVRWRQQEELTRASRLELEEAFLRYGRRTHPGWQLHVLGIREGRDLEANPAGPSREQPEREAGPINHGAMVFCWQTPRDPVPQQISLLAPSLLHGLAMGHAFEENVRFQQQLTKVLAHSMRSPFGSIQSLAEAIRDNPRLTEEGRREYLGRLLLQARLGLGFSDSILSLGGIRPLVKKKRFDLIPVLEEVIRHARVQARFLKLDIEPLAHPGIEVAGIESDESRIWQAIIQVLDNAIKYSNAQRFHQAEPVPPITVTLQERPRDYQILVEDHGIGIDLDDRRQAFRFFERGQRALRCGVDGLGIGLGTCKYCLEALGGRIALEPVAELGVRVTIQLPRT